MFDEGFKWLAVSTNLLVYRLLIGPVVRCIKTTRRGPTHIRRIGAILLGNSQGRIIKQTDEETLRVLSQR